MVTYAIIFTIHLVTELVFKIVGMFNIINKL